MKHLKVNMKANKYSKNMFYCIVFIALTFIHNAHSFWPPARNVEIDEDSFEIASDDEHYDEIQDEMIKLEDLVEFKSLINDGEKYKPLHSYVEFYNKMVANPVTAHSEIISEDEITQELHQEKEPIYAGFRDVLNKRFASKFKRDGPKNESKSTKLGEKSATIISFLTESPKVEEDYDYEKFKQEYEEALEKRKQSGKVFNYTKEEAIGKNEDENKKPKNCTTIEKSQYGIRAIGCLLTDLRDAKNQTDVKSVLYRTYSIAKIWIFIYIFIAVICWCQRGWCCCCFRCKMCFPRETIEEDKKFFVENPPGVLESEQYQPEPLKYEPTILEEDAYKQFAKAIKEL